MGIFRDYDWYNNWQRPYEIPGSFYEDEDFFQSFPREAPETFFVDVKSGKKYGSFQDFRLIEQKVEVQPAPPKLNLVDIPGANGSKDLTELPAGRVVYGDREITWTYALFPWQRSWEIVQNVVSRALNGKRCKIFLHNSEGKYYEGRMTVTDYARDGVLRQITVKAICSPYLRAKDQVIAKELTTEPLAIPLRASDLYTVPKIEVTAETAISYDGNTLMLSPGAHELTQLELAGADRELIANVTNGTGTITVSYERGYL